MQKEGGGGVVPISELLRISCSGFGRGSRYSLCRTSKAARTIVVLLIWLGPGGLRQTHAVGGRPCRS